MVSLWVVEIYGDFSTFQKNSHFQNATISTHMKKKNKLINPKLKLNTLTTNQKN